MDQKAYVSSRVDDQIEWYDRRSGDYQRQYKRYRIVEILCASSIPFLTGLVGEYGSLKYLIGLMGVVIAVVASLDSLIRPQELWSEYRGTAERLKQEKYLFETGTAPYDGRTAFQQFVENVEGIISGENSRWHQQQNKHAQERRAQEARLAGAAPQRKPQTPPAASERRDV